MIRKLVSNQKLHGEQLDREDSIMSYVSLVKTIGTGIV